LQSYLNLVQRVLDEGERRPNRTGVDTLALAGTMLEHDMGDGFPLLTTKFVPFRLVASELEFFIRGITDKRWLQERNNHIWDEWCRPDLVPYGHDEKTKARMAAESDLGPIYGWQWRNFGADYRDPHAQVNAGRCVDQLARVVHRLKTDHDDRRMIVSAWNPVDIPKMGLPPCHYAFQVLVIRGRLHLMWNQRSVDTALGLPFNIASYGLLLHLLALEAGLGEGRLVAFLGDTHVYLNHQEGLLEQLARVPYPLPRLKTRGFSSIFDWQYTDTQVEGYQHHPKIAFEIAV